MNCGLRIADCGFSDRGLKTPFQIRNPQSAIRNPQSNMKPFILIIEDDPDIAESIRYNLERDGAFVAQVALTGEMGLNIALGKGQSKQTIQSIQSSPSGSSSPSARAGDLSASTPDLIVLDLNLPG